MVSICRRMSMTAAPLEAMARNGSIVSPENALFTNTAMPGMSGRYGSDTLIKEDERLRVPASATASPGMTAASASSANPRGQNTSVTGSSP
jgi:hypothetical protein